MSSASIDLASSRLLSDDAYRTVDFPIVEDAAAGDEPVTVVADLATVRDAAVGFWQIEAGTARDVEADELFIVLGGRGRVTFGDGSELVLAPGVVVQLREGDETTWTIDDPLRKLFVVWPRTSER